ncbi:MAG: hypothetical protein F4X59_17535 [Holophagales bacterium]|nr:hypothetical protein [Holophagales bacterium]MYC11909.1 hypothetical protein [Holophagales bacterium]
MIDELIAVSTDVHRNVRRLRELLEEANDLMLEIDADLEQLGLPEDHSTIALPTPAAATAVDEAEPCAAEAPDAPPPVSGERRKRRSKAEAAAVRKQLLAEIADGESVKVAAESLGVYYTQALRWKREAGL